MYLIVFCVFFYSLRCWLGYNSIRTRLVVVVFFLFSRLLTSEEFYMYRIGLLSSFLVSRQLAKGKVYALLIVQFMWLSLFSGRILHVLD